MKVSKKVLKVCNLIISEGFEGYIDNAGLPNCPSHSDLIKAEQFLYNCVRKQMNKGK